MKLRITNAEQIQIILELPFLEFKQFLYTATGEVKDFPKTAQSGIWRIDVYNPLGMEIRGSLHQYFNCGTNETDFSFTDVKKAIFAFSEEFNLNPKLALIINLEFGVNLSPVYSANEILRQVICYKNSLPIHPYQNTKKGYLMDFKSGESYLKLYDKGVQQNTRNLLRIEVKGMKARYFHRMDIKCLQNLTTKRAAKKLGKRLKETIDNLILTDDTINDVYLTNNEQLFYLKMKDSKEWVVNKGNKKQIQRVQEKRFRTLVTKYGKRDIYHYLATLLSQKWTYLSDS